MPTLYVVATPIGNLSDASARMIDTLSSVRFIAAEDTRVTGNLLRHFGISVQMTSLHRHNEAGKADGIVQRMLSEEIDAALVTDAGTPGISDPGHLLVRAAAAAGIDVIAIAGPSAMAAALSISGFDTREFAFYGFLPRERPDIVKKLKEIVRGPRVAVLNESPHRVTALLKAVAETLPGCAACVCCDLTKLHEHTVRGSAQAVYEMLRDNPKTEKGEYCVVLDFENVALPEADAPVEIRLEAQLFDAMLSGMPLRLAIDEAVRHGARKNDAKRAALAVRRFLAAWHEE